MRFGMVLTVLLVAASGSAAQAQCAPAPDSAYFFRDLAEKRAAAKLSEDRSFYDGLLSDSFANKEEFIDAELAASHAFADKPSFAVSEFKLLEHRKGFVVASYLLTEAGTDTRQREVYQVESGKWRLTAVESMSPQTAQR